MEGQERGVASVFITPPIQFLVGIILFIALLNRERDLAVLSLLVLGVAFGARLWARASLSGIHCLSSVDKAKVFPGECLIFRIRAENRKFLPVRLQVKVPLAGGIASPGGETVLAKESGLLWYQRADVEWELTARRRGVHPVGPPRIAAGDLFGFFSKERKSQEIHEILVYPRLIPLRPFALPRRDFFGVPGAKSPVKDPIYILGTRDYQNGQPSKYIHWKASARHHRLQGKVFEPSEQEKVLMALEVDHFAGPAEEEDFERTLEAAASLAVRLDRQGIAVGLVTNGAMAGGGSPIVPIARNRQQLPAILEALARVLMKPQGNLLDILRRGLELTWGVSCLHFSYGEDGMIARAAEYFKHRKTPVLFLVGRRHFSLSEDGARSAKKTRSLDEICLKAGERR